MKIIMETSLENFEFWSVAKDTAEIIDEHGLWSTVESILEDLYPNGMSDTELNDIFWFESEWLFETLGINPYGEEEEEKGANTNFLNFAKSFVLVQNARMTLSLPRKIAKKDFSLKKKKINLDTTTTLRPTTIL